MGSFYGAWDYIAANAQKELISQLFMATRKESTPNNCLGNPWKITNREEI